MTKSIKRLGVFTSGGDAPGMNAAIRAVVRTAVSEDLHIYGIHNGYQGMINGDITRLEKKDVGNIIQRGGTILKTARSMEFMTPEGRKMAYESLQEVGIDALVAIGGNGTYTGAKVFYEEYGMPIVGLPGTIDNDIYGTDFTIGFDTACNTAIEAIDRIRDTGDAHDRTFFVEVMGRHSGFIGLYAGIGSGATAILVPERNMSAEELVDKLQNKLRRKKLFSLIVVAEGNPSGGAQELADKVQKAMPTVETKVTVIGHLQRGGSPTCMDRVLATRLGHSAVIELLKGKTGVSLGLVNNQISFTSFEDAITKVNMPKQSLIDMVEMIAM